jgi:hypothetical protein
MLFGSYSGYFAQSIRDCRTRSSSKRIGLRSMFCLKIPVYRDGKRGETPLTLFDKSFVTDLTVHVDVVSDEAPSLSPNIVCVWWSSCFVQDTVEGRICIINYSTVKCRPSRINTSRKYSKKSLAYYPNSVATFNLLVIAGDYWDIESNPGPNCTSSNTDTNSKNIRCKRSLRAPKCSECDKAVKVNNKRLYCTFCQ